MRIDRLSASKYKCYEQCPFKFFMEYHLGIRGGQTFAADYGTAIHDILERYACAKKDGTDASWQQQNKTGEDGLTIDQLEEVYIDLLLESGWRSESMQALWPKHRHVQECPKTCDTCEFHQDGVCGIVQTPVEDISGYDPDDKDKNENFDFGCPLAEFKEGVRQIEDVIFDEKPYSPFSDGRKIIATEQYFKLKIEDGDDTYLATGKIDLVTEVDDDTIEIYDYKTGRYKMSYPDCTTDIQLLMYYYAAKKLYPTYKNIMVTIYYLCGGKKQITPPFGPKDEADCVARIKALWRQVESDMRPQRRCDQPGGAIEFDHKCKYLCDIELCKKVHPKFMAFISGDGNIDNISGMDELEEFVLRLDDDG